ncbi:MAG: amino acid adenylation domain-containing protein, partial [Deltaproteobacteria bacterium]|nr:amino acid adenylation domain-containing protein [Deltaproteobacteria bacterium]
MSDITKKINGLNKEQLAAFNKELEMKGLRLNEKNQILKRKDCNNKSQKINQIDEEESYKLSHAQSRLWVLDQYGNSITYNMPKAFILKGELQTDAFKQAYSYMIKRHESLRTVFITDNGEPRQKILENPENNIKIIDLRGSIDPEKEARLVAEKNLLIPFNLETGPLVRFTVIRIKDDKRLLLFNMHHIISDGWSMNIFVKEFLTCYNSFRKGDVPDLKQLRIQYKDYSAWQNDQFIDLENHRQRGYWLEKLSGELPVLELPSDKIRPASKTFNGNSLSFSLSKEINSALNNLCRENNVSLFMMLQSLVKVLFHRYTGQNDIILGSPVAGRVHEDLEDQIGFYVNTLTLRDTIEGNLSFKEVLAGVKQTCTEAFDNQNYPFDRIVEDLDIKRDISRSPILDVLVVLQNNETTAVEFDGLELIPYSNENKTSKFDMTYNFFESEGQLFCRIEFNTDIYVENRIIRMIDHFKTLASSVIEAPEARVKDLGIIDEKEKNLLLNVFNDKEVDYPRDKTIVNLFEEQAGKTPNYVAVVFEDVELTYMELNEKANIVGHYLRDNYDIEPDDLVGVLLDRSEKMIIALLGILKSGAAYVPIDPGYPDERIDYMLSDSNSKLVISDNSEGINIDINEILNSGYSMDNPYNYSTPESLAYVLYTSGSTGKPKGVMVLHKNIISLVSNQVFTSFKDNDKLLLNGSISFDISTYEIWAPLINKVQIILTKKENTLDTVILGNTLLKNNITVLHLIPQLYDQLIHEDISVFQNLRLFLIGGDLVKPSNVCRLKKLYPHIRILHMYGPTENTTFSTCFEVEKEYEKLPLGKPVNNCFIYVLDKDNQLQPVGVNGEICVSGDGVSRGYLDDIQLTNKKYIHNPAITDGIIYKTGDLGKWSEDGNLEFLGRIDNQVKIRGFRIEFGEIEKTLLLHDRISSAVVNAKDGLDGDKQLAAYVVSDIELDISEIRSFLKLSLPYYMIPSYFIQIDEFPLTPNGKIDCNALPEPEDSVNPEVEYVAPTNDLQKKLVGIWQEVLGIEKIGIHDNFFELGGHSLKAIKVMSRIRKELEVNSFKVIFENPTIEALSEVIKNTRKAEYKQIELIPKQESYEISNAQRRLWVLDQYEEGSIAYNIPKAFILEGELQTDAFKQSYSYMIKRHESLRTVFFTEDGDPRQKILENPESNIKIIDLRGSIDPEKEARSLAEKDLLIPFNFEIGPLVRFTVIRIEDEKRLLLFNMHHIISDGWSMNIFIKEFLTSYNSFKKGKTPDLSPLRIQYKDYSAWQNDQFNDSENYGQRGYWLEKLSGELPVLELPSDKIRPASKTFNGNSLSFSLSKVINSALNNLCRDNNVSLFMMLQALVKVLFHRYTGQTDIILGSPIAGRVHEDLEDQIGFYINTLTLRDTMEGDLSFKEVLAGVKQTCTEAFDNQDYPFDRIVEDLDIKRDISRSPLLDVMVVLQNNETTAVEFEGLELTPYRSEKLVCKFDMAFNFSETAGSLFCGIEYNTDIYYEDRIKRLINHFKTLVSSVLENSQAKIKDLEIIGDEERTFLLDLFNDTKKDYPTDSSIVDLFEDQVEKTPDNIAVVFEEVELTYRELNRRANIVGHYLRDNFGIKPDDMVGVLLERSEKMVIAILGILKSGAAYVPIDSEYPDARIEYIIEDSDPKVVLVGKDYIYKNHKYLEINKILESRGNVENLERLTEPKNLAYIIYTSGSTGEPKGVLIEHRSVVNLVYGLDDLIYSRYNEKINISLFASFSFDASVKQLFCSVLLGHCLHIVPKEMKMNIIQLLNFYEKKDIDIADGTPLLLDLINNQNSKYLKGMKVKEFIIGGDALYTSSIEKLLSNFNISKPKVTNVYGPTECCVDSSLYRFSDLDLINSKILPIGKPIGNIKIFILDRKFKILPIGVAGEIYISGEGIARGYLNQSELTNIKFVGNPFMTGERMYRTGDFGRWLSDGNIEFLGRIDNQVKIRGFRIELGEIENALLQSVSISSAVVLAKIIDNGEKILVAYLVAEKGFEVSELRSFLMKYLPDYMIPSYFIHMDSFPLTPNGKIDKKAFPEPDESFSSVVEYVAPTNDLQKKLVGIWQEVLGIEKIGIYDNFYELGGHSLKAIRVVSRIKKELEVNSYKVIFENPTIEALSEVIKNTRKAEYKQIELIPKQESYEISNAQRRLWVLDQYEEGSIAYNMSFAFVLKGELDIESFNQAYSFMIE